MRKISGICAVILLFASFSLFVSADEEDGVQMYPGGDYGIDLGGGYEMMPDGELLAPSGFREDYQNTRYGPLAGEGFVVFPDFRFISDKSKKKEKEEPAEEYIFHPATTETSGSLLWGVSGP
ncbi:MAG: hypothetical protein GF408_05670 [Candidatus Omnitrophica bacterium]|nr:hypothetical protein [Candidatus Omnitrophota bacterium]